MNKADIKGGMGHEERPLKRRMAKHTSACQPLGKATVVFRRIKMNTSGV